MLGAFRVAFLRHRDAADDTRGRRLRQLSQLGALQVVDLVAELRERAGDQREQRDELGDPVACGEPARVRDVQAEPLEERALQCESLVAERRQRADRAGELADREPRLGLLDAREMSPDLRGPQRGLEAERDRQPGLAVGAAEHQRAAVRLGVGAQRLLDRGQLAARKREHALHHEPEPRVGDVLDGRAVVDPLGRFGAEVAAQDADQAERRVAACAGLLPHGLEVDVPHRGELARCVRGDDPELPLDRRERGDDLDPRARAARVGEQRARLVGRPQMAEDDRLAVHAISSFSARRTSSRLAPHGTIMRASSRSMPRSRRQHFVSVRSVVLVSRSSGQKSIRVRGSCP